MKSYSLSELNRQSGEVVDSAMIAPVSLTKRGKPKLVVMNAVTYEMLKRGKAHTIVKEAAVHFLFKLRLLL